MICFFDKASDKENIILLTAAVKVMHPEFSKFLPSNEAIDLNSENFPVDYPLEGALEKCLGGKQYVKTGVNSDLGLHIGKYKYIDLVRRSIKQ